MKLINREEVISNLDKAKIIKSNLREKGNIMEKIYDLLEDPNFRRRVLQEAIHRLFSEKEKRLIRRPSVRKKLYEKCGDKAFLMPDKLKFPIVNPLSKSCKPDCRLLYAAYLRADEWRRKHPEYIEIAKKAAELYRKNGCTKKLGIEIHEFE